MNRRNEAGFEADWEPDHVDSIPFLLPCVFCATFLHCLPTAPQRGHDTWEDGKGHDLELD